MITVMTTKTFLNALDDAYAKGVSAGANAQKVAGHDDAYTDGYAAGVSAQKLSDHEDQNRRLEEMYQYGKQMGKSEALAEVGEITLDDMEEAMEEVEE